MKWSLKILDSYLKGLVKGFDRQMDILDIKGHKTERQMLQNCEYFFVIVMQI